jgi:hypothetical protein
VVFICGAKILKISKLSAKFLLSLIEPLNLMSPAEKHSGLIYMKRFVHFMQLV